VPATPATRLNVTASALPPDTPAMLIAEPELVSRP
jgi:hypothetical protein